MVRAEFSSLRFSPRERRWLTLAIAVSLFVHLAVWGGYEVGKKYGWWERLQKPTRAQQLAQKNPPPVNPASSEPPLVFVDVSRVEKEPPKNTQYYSDKNSAAANPEADKISNQPKLTGTQKDIPKTENVPTLPKLAPSPPKANIPEPAKPVVEHPSSPEHLGDLKPDPKPDPKPEEPKPTPPRERPRTIRAAQQQLPGPKMQQEGGVHRQQLWSSLDVKATPFGEYDRKIVEAVTQHWYDLLDSRRFALDRTGRVILHFKLKADGTVGEMKILTNDAGTTLGYVCEAAVLESAPFAQWPTDMKRMIGANFREITFTFYYY